MLYLCSEILKTFVVMKVAEVIHHDAAKISKLIKKPLLNEL